MRPGRELPRNLTDEIENPQPILDASMRPGRELPRNWRNEEEKKCRPLRASMRPGRELPRNADTSQARNPKLYTASMRPGRELPRNLFRQKGKQWRNEASMRPGRELPRNPTGYDFGGGPEDVGFNEAGARTAPESPPATAGFSWHHRFNEAGARTAPEYGTWGREKLEKAIASMRPGRELPRNSPLSISLRGLAYFATLRALPSVQLGTP